MREQIESLQQKLDALLGGSVPATKTKKKVGRPAGKRIMSDEARAKIAAAQKARWAKTKGATGRVTKPSSKVKPAPIAKKKGGISAEGRAKLAAMKARWEAKKKGVAAPNAPAN